MAAIEMNIDGITYAGDDVTIFPVSSFAWAGDLKQISVTREVNALSAQIVVMQVVDDSRGAMLRCVDDDGAEYLRYTLTGTRIRGYSVAAGAERATEQFTAECQRVEMTTGEYVAAFG